MKEHNSHSSLKTLMNCNLYSLVLDLNFDVGLEPDASWVIREIASLSLSVSFIVRGYDSDLLAKVAETDCELIHHDTKASNS